MEKAESKKLVKTLSNKEVTFCDKSKILYYTADGTIDSLNNSIIHTVNGLDIPLSQRITDLFNNSQTVGSRTTCTSDQFLDSLPEVAIVLEKLPEDLVQKHDGSNSVDIKCELMPNQACPVFNVAVPRLPDNLTEFYESHLNENYVFENCFTAIASSEDSSNEVSELNGTVHKVKTKLSKIENPVFADDISNSVQSPVLQNSFLKLQSPTKSESSEFNEKSIRQEKESVMCDSDASVFEKYIVGQKKYGELSFDKYPCIHLEKLDLGPYLESISNTFNSCQSKNDVRMDLEVEEEIATNAPSLSKVGNCAVLSDEINFKTANLSSPETAINGSLDSTDIISSKEMYPRKVICRNLVMDNLSEVSSYDCSVLSDHKNSLKHKPSLLNKSVVKDTNSKSSSLDKNAEIKLPYVLLERLDLSLVENYKNSPVTNLTNVTSIKSHKHKKKNKSHKHKKENLLHRNSKCSTLKEIKRHSKNNASNAIREHKNSSSDKKKSNKSLRKRQVKIYKMIKKYLKLQIKEKKHKMKSKKRENIQKKRLESRESVFQGSKSDSESDIDVIYDSLEKKNCDQNKHFFQPKYAQCKKIHNCKLSSTMDYNAKVVHKKLADKYRLGFLSNKLSLRFYNRFLASERLLLSKSKMKKSKKKEWKMLFNRLKAVGLVSYR